MLHCFMKQRVYFSKKSVYIIENSFEILSVKVYGRQELAFTEAT